MSYDKILILDFGSQTTQLIAKRVRKVKVNSMILPFNTPIEKIDALKPKGIILSGGPVSVYQRGAPKPDPGIFNLGIPILGICYGAQFIAQHFGGDVEISICQTGEYAREYGKTLCFLNRDWFKQNSIRKKIKNWIPHKRHVWMSHEDRITRLPNGFEVFASSKHCKYAGIKKKNIIGVQFHPEVTHTEKGTRFLKEFAINVCGCQPNWNTKKLLKIIQENIRSQVKNKKVLHALSGGVDSTVLAILYQNTIPNQVRFVFVDTGLLNTGEADEVMRNSQKIGLEVQKFDKQKRFMNALKGLTDPQEKRNAIGQCFVDLFQEIILPNEIFSQGTLYPDTIESGPVLGPSRMIKLHHNLIEGMAEIKKSNGVIEPFKYLFKDEVRLIGRYYQLPEKIIERDPSPGPSAAIRVFGEVTEEKIKLRNQAHDIFIEELKKSGLDKQTSQSFAGLTEDKAVGLAGDQRVYGPMIILRAVATDNFMTADWIKLNPRFLERVSNRITNEVPGISRVLYDITQKPPGTIELM